MSTTNNSTQASASPSRWERLRDSYMWYSFKRDYTAQLCLAVFICMVIAAFASPLLAPTNPYDLSQIDIMSSELPPFWIDGADERYALGTDAQGRDLWSIVLYGTRVSLLIGFGAVILQALIGGHLWPNGGLPGRSCRYDIDAPGRHSALLLDTNGRYRGGRFGQSDHGQRFL